MRCADCGDPCTGDMCSPCRDVAAVLGHTLADRLAMLGVLPLA